jgi:uncharacterized membrane protein
MPSPQVFWRFIKTTLRVRRDEALEETYDEVEEGVYFRGVNVWLIGCSMILACIGLITNSLSAVIGAMLISPLMGPVIGLGFGLAVYDTKLVRYRPAFFI